MQIIKNAKFQVIHCTYSKVVDEKYRQSVCSADLLSLLTFRYFSTIISIFGAGNAPFFTAPAPAPTKMCRLRRLRFQLRLRIPVAWTDFQSQNPR